MTLALKIGRVIAKYGSKAWKAIKSGAAKYYDSLREAWEAGLYAFAKWLANHWYVLEIVKEALEAAGLM
ncbi:hypothetical protein GLW00_19775 [Halobacillus litoralis]|uniref:Uncharacterized protein n=1 Tax=Halobacillus litoralis TaxID=45668 RepID=A0A845FH38_9BACI|nr:hypothetical protein [Halobacillus litoralis]MYL73058.1 hypothetical protein [Halobacillus litoralis]